MLSGEGMQGRKTVKNNNRSNPQKQARAAHFFCTFLCRCFGLQDFNVKLRETS